MLERLFEHVLDLLPAFRSHAPHSVAVPVVTRDGQ
jgi:hypothetical protein